MKAPLLAPALGIAICTQHACTKLPRLAKLATAESGTIPSVGGSYGDACVYATRAAYHLRSGYPLSTWAELPLLMLFNTGCIVLSSGRSSTQRWLRDIATCAVLAVALWRVPFPVLQCFTVGTAPLLAGSYLSRARANYRLRSTGDMQARAVLRRLARSLVRVYTSAAQLGGDASVLVIHGLGAIGCSVLLAQLCWYRRPTERATRPVAVPPGPLSGGAKYDYLLAALMWRSLGGFSPETPARRITRRQLRAAFARADRDSDGAISLNELSRSLRRVRPGFSDAAVARMLRVADLDGDGQVSFDEYAQIMTTELPGSGVV